MNRLNSLATGWLPDLPKKKTKKKDFLPGDPQVSALLERWKPRVGHPDPRDSVDLRGACSGIESQGNFYTCSACAAVGMLEYFEKKTFERFYVDASVAFVHRLAWEHQRQTDGLTGPGVQLRHVMRILSKQGAPEDSKWPYQKLDVTPPPGIIQEAKLFQGLMYYRLDKQGSHLDWEDVLARIETRLRSGLPCVFGFLTYDWIPNDRRKAAIPLVQINEGSDQRGEIPYPDGNAEQHGGHAVMAAGYDRRKTIQGPDGTTHEGALLIRNSWGTGWGQSGYGWLPYSYVRNDLCSDFWSIIRADYTETKWHDTIQTA